MSKIAEVILLGVALILAGIVGATYHDNYTPHFINRCDHIDTEVINRNEVRFVCTVMHKEINPEWMKKEMEK